MDISIVIPLYNEADSLKELFERLEKVAEANFNSYELFFIDDGSTDNSWNVLLNIRKENSNVKLIRFYKNYGKTEALKVAFENVVGEIVVTIDADLQDYPEEIPELCNKLKTESLDLIAGWKQKRKDNKLTKNLPSLLFNWAARKTSGVVLHDFNCGLKAYRKEVIKSFDLHGDMHRYLPVLAKNNGYGNIGEKKIKHAARKHGVSKFGSDRFIRGLLDLVTLWFASKFLHRPMHLFGSAGIIMVLFGVGSAFYLGASKLFALNAGLQSILVTDNPFFYISLTCIILGSQLFLAGFISEILIRKPNTENGNRISEKHT